MDQLGVDEPDEADFQQLLTRLVEKLRMQASVQHQDADQDAAKCYAGQVDMMSRSSGQLVGTWLELFSDGRNPLYTFRPSPTGAQPMRSIKLISVVQDQLSAC